MNKPINVPTIPEGIKFLLSYEGETTLALDIAKDLYGRHKIGVEKYGVALTFLNGRNNFLDIYEEYLDAYNYTVNALLGHGIPVGEIDSAPTWGPEHNKDVRILFELLTYNIKALKILKGQFKCN